MVIGTMVREWIGLINKINVSIFMASCTAFVRLLQANWMALPDY